jgi:hypothetical protein
LPLQASILMHISIYYLQKVVNDFNTLSTPFITQINTRTIGIVIWQQNKS